MIEIHNGQLQKANNCYRFVGGIDLNFLLYLVCNHLQPPHDVNPLVVQGE